jgi:signal transduction histidine kinase
MALLVPVRHGADAARWVARARPSSSAERHRRYRKIAAHLGAAARLLGRPPLELDPVALGSDLVAELVAAGGADGASLALWSDRLPVAVAALGTPPAGGWNGPDLRAPLARVRSDHRACTVQLAERPLGILPVLHDQVLLGAVCLVLPDGTAAPSRVAAAIVRRRAAGLAAAVAYRDLGTLARHGSQMRLARQMHDGVAQDVASLGYLLDDVLEDAAGPLEPRLRRLRGEVADLVLRLRLSVHDLREDGLATGGVAGALAELARTQAHRGSMVVHLRIEETENSLTPFDEQHLLLVAREAVTNAGQHSGGSHLWVSCVVGPGGAVITVEDDGPGLPPLPADSRGFRRMRQSAAAIGATVSVQSRRPQGTCVRIEMGRIAVG